MIKYWMKIPAKVRYIAIISIIVLGVIIYAILRKKRSDLKAPKADIGGTLPLTEAEKQQISSLVDRLYGTLHGFKLFGSRSEDELLEEYYNTPDRIFIGVYNEFNRRYFTPRNGTLKQWIQDETFEWRTFKRWDKDIINRMDQLNLK